jgi:C-terminal peptidase prc
MQEMIDELGDEHSGFYSPEEVAEEEEQLSGQLDYEGIGIYVTTPKDKVFAVLLHVFPDSPAERAGLQPHDRILKVDGLPVVDAGGAEHLDLLQGPVDSQVRLWVQTPGRDPRELIVTREQIHAQLPVETHRILETNVGYLLLPTFWDQTITERVRQALESLMAEGELDGLILDLRTNGGGLLTEMEGTLAIFTEGELGAFASRDAERPLIVKADPIGRSQELPLVILVGRETESFGEVFSGVLQENGRAQVVGRTTYGNVETLWQVDLEDGSRAWIASETFRPPSGADWEESGIIPDVEIPVDWDEFTAENDEQLRAALELLLQALGE